MAVPVIDGYDVTHAFIAQAPTTGQAALYSTGTPDIKATPEDIASRPGCLLIDQSPVITGVDVRSDYFDGESGALTPAEIAQIVRDAISSFEHLQRPGQRWPAVYCSRSSLPQYVNALDAGGLHGAQIGLVIADYNYDRQQAIDEVSSSVPGPGNPYPVVGRQYSDQGGGGAYDLDIFSQPWVERRSGMSTPTVLAQQDWRWCRKCQGLFFGPYESASHCPAGGTHDGSQSGNYVLTDIAPTGSS